jgi:ribosomal protein S13
MSENIYESARALAQLGDLVFVPVHLCDNWKKFPCYEKNWIQALKLFISSYAFERSGAPRSYKNAAIQALEKCMESLSAEDASQKVWEKFQEILNSADLNAKLNPLNPGGSKCDAVAFCKRAAASEDCNIYLFLLRKIQANKIEEAHKMLMEIRGIGPKIASLFLRDVAIAEKIEITNLDDRHLLQPIDVWLERIAQILADQKIEKRNVGKWLVDLADKAGCCALRLNAGSWYFGSQVAQTESQLKCDLKNMQNFASAVERYRQDAMEQAKQLCTEVKSLETFVREAANDTLMPPGPKPSAPAAEAENDRFTWHIEDVVWIREGQTEEDAIEEAKRRRAAKMKSSDSKPTKF